jgi:hypothetical protein
MYLDLVESYPMVKSNLHFEHFGQTGVTGVGDRSDQFVLLNRLRIND